MRRGRDITRELQECSGMRESLRSGVGESANAESWKKNAEAFKSIGERVAVRLPKFNGKPVCVVVEGPVGAEIPDSVRREYAQSQVEREEAEKRLEEYRRLGGSWNPCRKGAKSASSWKSG